METIGGGKSLAFVTSYLLGAGRRVLAEKFIEDYNYSLALEKLDVIKEARMLRALTSVRQSLVREYDHFAKATDLTVAGKGRIETELNTIHLNGVDLYHEFRVNPSTLDLVNFISAHIDIVLIETLDKLGLKVVEGVQSLFKFPQLQERQILKMHSAAKENIRRYPLQLIILKRVKAITHITDLFDTDVTMYRNCFALYGVTRDISQLNLKPFDWEAIKLKTNKPNLPVKEASIFYVDCDNTDYFSFLAFLETLNDIPTDGRHVIKLFMDRKSRLIWHGTEKLLSGNFDFELFDAERIHSNKSVVDIVITAEITRDSVKPKQIKQALVSSDSDFYGILVHGVDLSIYYSGDSINYAYLTYLNEKGVPNYDIRLLDREAMEIKYRNHILTYLCLAYLPRVSMANWTPDYLTEAMVIGHENDTVRGFTLNESEALSVTEGVLLNLQVITTPTHIQLSANGFDVEVPVNVA